MISYAEQIDLIAPFSPATSPPDLLLAIKGVIENPKSKSFVARYDVPDDPVAQRMYVWILRGIVGDRDCFVMTSNVDRYFHQNGFSEDRIYTPQGDYEKFQGFNRCHVGT